MFIVNIKKSAKKYLDKVQDKTRTRIIIKLKELSSQKNPELVGLQLTGIDPKTFRIRVGDYRVIYRVNTSDNEIMVFKIGDRKDIYKR